MDNITFIAAYLAIGLATLAAVLFISREDRLRERRIREWKLGLEVDNEPQERLSHWAITLLTGAAIVLAWPAAMVVGFMGRTRRRRLDIDMDIDSPVLSIEEVEAEEQRRLPTNRIAITRDHVVGHTSVEDIEHAWSVVDAPTGLETPTALGVRNRSWKHFVELFTSQQPAVMWSFEVRKSDIWELRHRIVTGVVIERDGTFSDYYLLSMKRDDEVD